MRLLASYTDPLNDKRIEVWQQSNGACCADVSLLDQRGEVASLIKGLPLQGLPSSLPENKFSAYLHHTHLVVERGIDGVYNRVIAHVSGVGGGNPKIPFQPGLAIGSIVAGETIEKMATYAQLQAKRDQLEEQIRSAEQQLELVGTKIKSRSGKGPKDALTIVHKKEELQVQAYIEQLSTKLLDQASRDELPIFEAFQVGAVVSPLDMGATVIEIQPRGFDTAQFSSQYILMSANEEAIHDKIKQSSSTSSFSGSGGWLFGSTQISRTQSDAAASRVLQIKKEQKAEGVLVINSFVTTRNVRCVTKPVYRRDILEQILSVMKTGDDNAKKQLGITKFGNSEAIYILSEVICGGSFTALVTFLDESQMNRQASLQQSERTSSTSISGSANFWTIRAKAGYSSAGTSASKSEDDVLSSVSQTRIAIEFFAQGAIPAFTRNTLEKEILSHLKLDPSKYELSSQDVAGIEKIVKSTGEERQIAILQQDVKMKNAQVGILNSYRGMTADKQVQNVHTMESVMGAYENFADQISHDKECGIPLGFNYMILTRGAIEKELETEAPTLLPNSGAASAAATPTTGPQSNA